MCCLKRPFDDQSQPRIRLEAEAVLSLMAMESAELRIVRSAALMLENAVNPVRERAARVAHWLSEQPAWRPERRGGSEGPRARADGVGVQKLSTRCTSPARGIGALLLATVDDRLLSAAARTAATLRTRVCGVLECVRELRR
jgi:hypothetical protein